METVRDFISLGSKVMQVVTAAVKLRHLLLGRKPMTNLDSVLKSRDITLLMVFSAVVYGCESWIIKKAKC